jgi:hypothetical protein
MRKRRLPSPDRADAVVMTSAATPPADRVVEADDEDDGQISPY